MLISDSMACDQGEGKDGKEVLKVGISSISLVSLRMKLLDVQQKLVLPHPYIP